MALHDDYLPCENYIGKELDSQNDKITKFFETEKYYFALLGPKGEVLLKSEGYTTLKARENGLASVLKNILEPKRISVVFEENVYRVILKAGNHQEIAVSCDYQTEADAKTSAELIGNFSSLISSKTSSSKKSTETKTKSSAKKAETKAEKPETKAAKVKETKSKKTAAIESEVLPVNQEMVSDANTVTNETQNLVETAASVNSTMEGEVFAQDQFLNSDVYLNQERIWDSYGITGFVKFRNYDNGKYYFGVYNPDGSLYLRSKGYEDQDERDNAFDLMESSILLEENYKVEQVNGKYYAILFEYNEVLAISKEFDTFIDAFVTTPGGRPKENVIGTMY